jgi:hypothetical protein
VGETLKALAWVFGAMGVGMAPGLIGGYFATKGKRP